MSVSDIYSDLNIVMFIDSLETFENSEDPDEITGYAAFHQSLHFLLR